jgi:microcystin-dependent protein
MAKTKVSEWSSNPADNTDVGGVDINEGCAPSGINNAIRDVMSQIKDMQTGADGDNFAVGGNLSVAGNLAVTGTSAFTGAVTFGLTPSFPSGAGLVPSGCIVMWSGSVASIPSGWLLCNGSSGTPDLRNRFLVGAGSTYSVGGTGGSADAIVVSHTHSATVTDPGHDHTKEYTNVAGAGAGSFFNGASSGINATTNSNTTGISVSISTVGSSGTNANLPPYYALAYIMKA